MLNYFNNNDNFIYIIQSTLYGIASQEDIVQSKHGKSSYVFFVNTENGAYLFKFPRTDFQVNNIEREKIVTDAIRQYIDCKIPDISIGSFQNKKFAYYQLIKGNNMSDVDLDDCEQFTLSLQLANIISNFTNIKANDINLKLKTKREIIEEFCKDFSYKPDFSSIEDVIDDNENIIHGDFHRSNILLDSHKNLCGLLDFSTFCYGSIYFDIGHMCFSMYEQFNEKFINACEQYLNKSLDINKLKRVISFLDDMINKHYLPYIKKGDTNV